MTGASVNSPLTVPLAALPPVGCPGCVSPHRVSTDSVGKANERAKGRGAGLCGASAEVVGRCARWWPSSIIFQGVSGLCLTGRTFAVAFWRLRWAGKEELCAAGGMTVPKGCSVPVDLIAFYCRFALFSSSRARIRNESAGGGGSYHHPHWSRFSVALGRQPIIPWKNCGPAFTMATIPP